jgi:hypothetical protein
MPLCTVDIPTACRGVREAESGINIKSYRQRTSDEREYLRDSDGTVTGFFHCFNLMQEGTIEGEIVTNIDAVLGGWTSFGTALTLANPYDGYGVTTGDFYPLDIETTETEGEICSVTVNIERYPEVSGSSTVL